VVTPSVEQTQPGVRVESGGEVAIVVAIGSSADGVKGLRTLVGRVRPSALGIGPMIAKLAAAGGKRP
jgi:hypothetical protein